MSNARFKSLDAPDETEMLCTPGTIYRYMALIRTRFKGVHNEEIAQRMGIGHSTLWKWANHEKPAYFRRAAIRRLWEMPGELAQLEPSRTDLLIEHDPAEFEADYLAFMSENPILSQLIVADFMEIPVSRLTKLRRNCKNRKRSEDQKFKELRRQLAEGKAMTIAYHFAEKKGQLHKFQIPCGNDAIRLRLEALQKKFGDTQAKLSKRTGLNVKVLRHQRTGLTFEEELIMRRFEEM